MKTALTIAGSDCSGGAGIQADLKTMTAYGVYGMSVITALTAQNTLGVTQNNLINADVVSAQLMSVLSDITPNAIKIGMLGNGQIATVVAEILQDFFSPSTQSPSSLQAHENAIPKSSIQIMYRHYGCAILLKGGHATGNADDLLYDGTVHWFHASRINCTNTHGTGCTLSSAIASALCLGKTLPDAVYSAKEYVRGAMSTGLDLGHGNGPLNHCWNISK